MDDRSGIPAADLARILLDTRERTLSLVRDLEDPQMMGPRLAIVNPLLWEIGHVAWFQERWVLRHLRGETPARADGDSLYDSARVAHDTRWDLPLPSRDETLRYMDETLNRSLDRLGSAEPDGRTAYFYRLAILHEAMHAEAFTYTRQTLVYPRPDDMPDPRSRAQEAVSATLEDGTAIPDGDASVPGGTFLLGAARSEPFVFDNEKWAHPVEVRPFRIARAPVTNAAFAAFVEDGGYERREHWSEEGWGWRKLTGAEHPVYWRRAGGRWERREFDRWLPLGENLPLIHVAWYEADAYCRWAGRRLPLEVEWEAAAAGTRASDGTSLAPEKRRFPWGEEAPTPSLASLDAVAGGVVSAAAHPAGESAFGCRQMIGNVWEWTATPFLPYPDFVADPYKEYSAPWFDGRHMVLRGGCWATRSFLIGNTWRNFYTRDRRDVFGGFRTCAVTDRDAPA